MRLSELAEVSGTSAATIKYYRREGLLPAGRRVTTTHHEYGSPHLERLRLIRVLRELAHASIARIGRHLAILDDPDRPLIDALADAQLIALGIGGGDDGIGGDTIGGGDGIEHGDGIGGGDDGIGGGDGGEHGDASSGGDGIGPTDGDQRPPAPEHPAIAPLLAELGWPDIDSLPRRALDEQLRTLESWGMPSDRSTVRRYAEAMSQVARTDVAWLREQAGQEGQPSDDLIVLRAITGTIAYDRLVRVLRALGHTSFSVLEEGRDTTQPPGDE